MASSPTIPRIIHVDMDAFYASVEQLDNPKLKNKPVAVGGSKEHGVVAAASYEARKYGIHSAMPSSKAARLCPNLIFVKPRFERYKEFSQQIREIFLRYTEKMEPLAMDEAFLDVTENKLGLDSATFIARSIKTDIQKETGLVASAGVSYNKFLAKIASDYDKPDGLFTISPEKAVDFIHQLPIKQFFGVGKATEEKLKELQIFKGKHILNYSKEELERYIGKFGKHLHQLAHGIDNRAVKTHRERKSVGTERTFFQPIFDTISFRETANSLIEKLWQRYDKYQKNGKTLSLKIKYVDFTMQTKAQTATKNLRTIEDIQELANSLLDEVLPLQKEVRLIGFQISNFSEEWQLRIFEE